MKRSLSRVLLAAWLCACAAAPLQARAAASALCAATARHPVADPRIRAAIGEAQLQHQLFGGRSHSAS